MTSAPATSTHGVIEMSRAKRYCLWIVLAAALFGALFFLSFAVGTFMPDESWFLQVVNRALAGEVLYRDVFVGVTPLSVYVTAIFAKVFGVEAMLLRALGALFYTFTILLACHIALRFKAGSGSVIFLALAFVVYSPVRLYFYYDIMANLFSLACLSAILYWLKRNSRGRDSISLACAGVAAGLCFASKQNIGLYVLAATVVIILAGASIARLGRREMLRSVSIILLAFLLTSALSLLPVFISGGTDKFLDYCFLNKSAYLRFGRVSYLDGLRDLFSLDLYPRSIWETKLLYWALPFLLAPLALIAMLYTCFGVRGIERMQAVAVFIFAVVAFLGIFPRADAWHLRIALPSILLGLVYCWQQFRPTKKSRRLLLAQAALLIFLAGGLMALFIKPLRWLASGDYELSSLPHFRGVLIDRESHAWIHKSADQLKSVVGETERPFLLMWDAGFYYLVAGLKNPTPFDFPLVTAFGRYGEADVVEAISRREIRVVCMSALADNPLRPALLEDYVKANMVRTHTLEFCAVFRVVQ